MLIVLMCVYIIRYNTSLYIVQTKAETYIVDNEGFVFTFIYFPSTYILANYIFIYS